MTFLNPAILLGLAAAALPLIIHLFNIRKVKDVEFSTLMFLKEIQKNKIRKVKLKQWFLLLLRTLLILLLVIAFARPTLERVSIGNNSATKSSVCFLVDDSFSLQLKDEEGSGFNQAKKTAKNIVQNLQDNDEISIITFSGKAVFKTNKKEEVNRFLDQLKISEKRTDFAASFSQAAGVLSGSKNISKEIYVISDFQKNNFVDLKKFEIKENDIKLYFVSAGFDNLDNLSVTDFKLNNKILTKGKKINFSAEVFNTTTKKISGKIASLFINGVRKARKSFDVEPGKKTLINFETLLENDGLVDAFVEIEEDTIPEDNKRYLSFFVPRELKVLVLRDNAFDSSFIEAVLDKEVSSFDIKLTSTPSNRLSSKRLENFDVVFLIGSKNISGSKEIKNYLLNGGSLVYFVSSTPDIKQINKFFGKIGSLKALSLNTPAKGVNNYFENVDYKHPLFSDLFSNEKPKFSSPELKKHIKVEHSGSVDKIISLLDDSPVLMEKALGKGKVLIFTISPEISFSNLPVKGIFAPMINKLLMYCGTKIKKDNLITAGTNIFIDYNKIVNNQYKVGFPDQSIDFVNLDEKFNKSFAEYNRMESTGNYKVYSNNKLIDYFSVNFDPAESELKFLAGNELEEIGKKLNPNGDLIIAGLSDNFEEIINQTRSGTELWQYFLIAALLTALLEMLVSRGVKKDLAGV